MPDALRNAVYITVLLQLLVILPHEFGHIVMSRCFGIKRGTLFIGGIIGGWLPDDDYGFDRLTTGRRIAIFAAGPAINFMVAILCAILHNRWHLHASSLLSIAEINVFSGLLNLIPIFPLDGGRIFRELLVIIGVKTSQHLTYVRFAAAVSGLGWMLLILKHGHWTDWFTWLLVTIAALYLLMDRNVLYYEKPRNHRRTWNSRY
ncbi:MAG: site-2 protease family protein [Desulfuromonadaceae bacterium]|nr:site-2 protease family protein [Desulfuromonadaceae bacterium]